MNKQERELYINKFREAITLISKGWCQHAHAKTFDGTLMSPKSPNADSWSLFGALYKVSLTGYEVLQLNKLVAAELPPHSSISIWNDDKDRTIQEVLAVLKSALSKLQQET